MAWNEAQLLPPLLTSLLMSLMISLMTLVPGSKPIRIASFFISHSLSTKPKDLRISIIFLLRKIVNYKIRSKYSFIFFNMITSDLCSLKLLSSHKFPFKQLLNFTWINILIALSQSTTLSFVLPPF